MKTISSFAALAIMLVTIACAGGGATSNTTATSTADPAANQDRGQAELMLDAAKVSVDYGRPNLRGRNIEALIQPGDEWRLGSNAPTTLATDVALKFGDKVIAPGKYVLKAKLIEAKKWHLLIESMDHTPVAEVPLELKKQDSATEVLTINLEKKEGGGRLIIQWGNLSLATDFQKSASA